MNKQIVKCLPIIPLKMRKEEHLSIKLFQIFETISVERPVPFGFPSEKLVLYADGEPSWPTHCIKSCGLNDFSPISKVAYLRALRNCGSVKRMRQKVSRTINFFV